MSKIKKQTSLSVIIINIRRY